MQGIFVFYKPKGQTSYDLIRGLKKYFPGKKIGHGGTLDPFAEGVLIIGIGKDATKQLGQFLKNSKKEYLSQIVLGITSDTFDITGKITKQRIEKWPSKKEVLRVLKQFQGEILQTPPPYSAIKIKGIPAYKKARAGQKVILGPKKVIVYNVELLDYYCSSPPSLSPPSPLGRGENVGGGLNIKLCVGSGFYVRSFANDIGKKLGTGACLKGLVRTKINDFSIEQALTIKDLINNNIELKAIMKGRVQGIFFRNFCEKWANTLNLTGYAKNLPSGQEVEIIAQGAEAGLEKFLEQIKIGPPMSQVKEVFYYFSKPQQNFPDFQIL